MAIISLGANQKGLTGSTKEKKNLLKVVNGATQGMNAVSNFSSRPVSRESRVRTANQMHRNNVMKQQSGITMVGSSSNTININGIQHK